VLGRSLPSTGMPLDTRFLASSDPEDERGGSRKR
jgi:hypothetical protein